MLKYQGTLQDRLKSRGTSLFQVDHDADVYDDGDTGDYDDDGDAGEEWGCKWHLSLQPYLDVDSKSVDPTG